MNKQEARAVLDTFRDLPQAVREFWLSCIDGDINLTVDDSWRDNPPGLIFTPSAAARRSYLYPQCISVGDFGPGHYTRRKGMQSYLLAETLSGGGELQYEGETLRLQRDDCFLIDCRREHYYFSTSPEGWSYRILHFDGVPMADLYAHFLQGGTVKFRAEKGSPVRALLDRLFDAPPPAHAGSEIVYNRLLTDLMTEVVLAAAPAGQKPLPRLVQGVLDYISKNYASTITLDGLAGEFFVSKYHLSREFKKYTGFSPNEYLIDTRINAAKALLRSTDLSIGEISQQVGVSSADHFLYLFKSRENTRPSVYRKQWRNL